MIPSGDRTALARLAVYQRGLVIDSQPRFTDSVVATSISKGIGD